MGERIGLTDAAWAIIGPLLPPERGLFQRWAATGRFDALLETLAELVERDATADMIDTTMIRADQHAAGARGAPRDPKIAWGPARRAGALGR